MPTTGRNLILIKFGANIWHSSKQRTVICINCRSALVGFVRRLHSTFSTFDCDLIKLKYLRQLGGYERRHIPSIISHRAYIGYMHAHVELKHHPTTEADVDQIKGSTSRGGWVCEVASTPWNETQTTVKLGIVKFLISNWIGMWTLPHTHFCLSLQTSIPPRWPIFRCRWSHKSITPNHCPGCGPLHVHREITILRNETVLVDS